VQCFLDAEGGATRLAALVEEALPIIEAAGDDTALFLVHRAHAHVLAVHGRMDSAVEAYERASVHAERAGLADRSAHWSDYGRFHGTTPLTELLRWEDELDERDRRDFYVRQDRAWAMAMLGRIDEARTMIAEQRADLAERGSTWVLATVSAQAGVGIERLAGDPAAAVALGEESCRMFEKVGRYSALRMYAGWVAQASYECGRLAEADRWAARAAESAASDDVWVQMLWRQARAKVLACRGEHPEAERRAREAVAIAEGTELLNFQADACADLAEVLVLAGRTKEGAEALEQALARYERKENLVMAERMRARLEALRVTGSGSTASA
jgi:tetratricopeptide (TPR) repeat protein